MQIFFFSRRKEVVINRLRLGCCWFFLNVIMSNSQNSTSYTTVPVLLSLQSFSYISFSSFSFPDSPYRIFFLNLPKHPCHLYLVVIKQQLTVGSEHHQFKFIIPHSTFPSSETCFCWVSFSPWGMHSI